jgi:hypothetical protein
MKMAMRPHCSSLIDPQDMLFRRALAAGHFARNEYIGI